MIFATVGTQLPFPRLITCLDDFAGELSLSLFAQTADPSTRPKHIDSMPFLRPDDYEKKVAQCTLLVGHAGIGTVLQAKRRGKPLILFPRLARFGEHRNDHQLATARFLQGKRGIYLAFTPGELRSLLCASDLVAPDPGLSEDADTLIAAVAEQLQEWRNQLR